MDDAQLRLRGMDAPHWTLAQRRAGVLQQLVSLLSSGLVRARSVTARRLAQ
jgi:hypothetical protein